MRSLAFFSLGLALLTCGRAQFVTINFGGTNFLDGSSTTVPDGRLVLLLANTGGAGFAQLQAGSLNVGSILNGTYQVLARAAVDNGIGTTGSANNIQLGGATFPNLSTGDQLAVVWFPTLSAASDFSVISGASYGLYTVNSSSAWEVPAAGSNITLTVPGGQVANLVTAIPEPATYAIVVGLATLGVATMRRRKPGGSSQLPSNPRQPLLDLRP